MPGGMGKPRGGDDFHVENQWIYFLGDFQNMMIVPLEICRDFQIEENTYVIAMKSTLGYPKGVRKKEKHFMLRHFIKESDDKPKDFG